MTMSINKATLGALSIPVGLFLSASAFAAEAGGGGLLDAVGLDFRTIIIQAIGFLVVLLILWKFVFGRVGGVLADRQNEIISRMNKLEADQKALDRLNAETRQRMNEIEAEAQAKIQAAMAEGNAERQRILDQARREASNELERARVEIQREKDEAILELRGVVAELAIGAASEIIAKQLALSEHQRIIDQYIQRLPANTAHSS